MGVKSTVELTRIEAVEKAADMQQQLDRRQLEARFWAMSNRDLEHFLEEKNDDLHDGEGFENYLITDRN
jgi:hypothetical protein